MDLLGEQHDVQPIKTSLPQNIGDSVWGNLGWVHVTYVARLHFVKPFVMLDT